MNMLKLCIIFILITNITCHRLTRNIAMTTVRKHELRRKQVKQTGAILDLRYISRNNKPGRFHSIDTLYYDPVFENHSVLADFLNKKEVEADSEMILKPRERKKSNCIGLCKTSLCPWDVEIDMDEKRVPKNIAYARCKSDTCDVDISGMPKLAKLIMESKTHCEMLKTYIYATKNGEDVWYNWPVACICVQGYTRNRIFGRSLKGAHAIEKTDLKTKPQVKNEFQAKTEREIAFKTRTNKKQVADMLVNGKRMNGIIEPENRS